MRKHTNIILICGFIFTLLISNGIGFVRDGIRLDSLRKSVLRLHILADSDTEDAQKLKLKVRDGLLQSEIFEGCDTLAEAELTAAENLDIIEEKAEENSDYDDDGNLIEGEIDKDDLSSWRNPFLDYICDEWEELAK